MLCNVCRQRAQVERTVFHGVTPRTIRLCQPCADRVELVDHMHRISGAGDHAAKTAAVDDLVAAVERAKATTP